MKVLLTVFLLLLSSLGWCQTKTAESFFKERNFDSVISLLTKGQRDKELSFREYFLLSRSYVRERQFNNGYVLTTEMIAKAQKEKDTVNLLKAYNLKTEHILELDKIKEGVRLCDSIIPFYRKRDSLELMSLCFKCGLLFHYDQQHKKAYNTYQKITKKEYRSLSLFTNNFAIILNKLNRKDEALSNLKETLELKKANIELKKSSKKGDLEGKKTKKSNINSSLNVQYLNIANIYIDKGEMELAKKYLDSAYISLKKNTRIASKKMIFEEYYNVYRAQGKQEKAASVLDSIFVINKELFENRIEERIHSIEAANSKEDVLIKRARFVDNELEISKNQVLTGTLILLSLILILIIGIFILKYRHIQSRYKSILTEQQLNWVRLNPEYLSNSFNTMQGMIHDKHPKTIVYLSKFSKLLRLILEGSRKSLISLKEETDAIKFYLEIQQLETKNNLSFHIKMDELLEELEIYVPHMLIQPFVSDIIRKSKRKTISDYIIDISITYNNDILSCVIIDNCGIENKEEQSTGSEYTEVLHKAKEILKIFTKKLNVPSDITVEGIKKHGTLGTKVSLILPYKNETL